MRCRKRGREGDRRGGCASRRENVCRESMRVEERARSRKLRPSSLLERPSSLLASFLCSGCSRGSMQVYVPTVLPTVGSMSLRYCTGRSTTKTTSVATRRSKERHACVGSMSLHHWVYVPTVLHRAVDDENNECRDEKEKGEARVRARHPGPVLRALLDHRLRTEIGISLPSHQR